MRYGMEVDTVEPGCSVGGDWLLFLRVWSWPTSRVRRVALMRALRQMQCISLVRVEQEDSVRALLVKECEVGEDISA